MGNTIIYIGMGIVVIGLAYKFGLLGWFGNLPGDIKYQNDNTSVFYTFYFNDTDLDSGVTHHAFF